MVTPEIRFTSEQDDWKLIDLEQNATYSKGRGYSKNDVVKTGTPVVLYGRLYTNFELEIDQVDTFVRPVQDSVISSGNEVVVPASGETPEDIARASAIIRPGIILGSDLNIIRPNAKLNPTFLASSLTYGAACKDLMSKAQGNVIVHLKNDDIRSLTVFTPSLAEQTKINSFFRYIDNQINGLKNSSKQLKNLKQSMLVKMFPQGGASVPEIRFEGFTGDWEEATMGDVSYIKTGPFGSTLHAEDYVSDGIPIITTEHFKKWSLPSYNSTLPQVSDDDALRLSSYSLKPGDIVFSRVGSVDINAVVYEEQDGWLFSGRVLRVRPLSINSDFLHFALSTPKFRADIINRAVGQTMPSINTQILAVTSIQCPSQEEQAAIGSYFRQLDQLIELEEAKLTKLTQLKTAFLSKMFV